MGEFKAWGFEWRTWLTCESDCLQFCCFWRHLFEWRTWLTCESDMPDGFNGQGIKLVLRWQSGNEKGIGGNSGNILATAVS